MRIRQRIVDGVVIFDLQGRMTADLRDELLEREIRSALQQGHRRIALNLEGISYMDSTCLGEIVSAYLIVSRGGGRLGLLNVPSRIQHLLDVAQLTMLDMLDLEQTDTRRALTSGEIEPQLAAQ